VLRLRNTQHTITLENFMKLRLSLFLIFTTLALSACNFTLAADVTPPPGYVPPTPMPTLGPLHPASAPDIENGAVIYVEKCAPCHGDNGLGDGAQGKQLPVTVAAFALPETAHKASPATWFTVVSQGNMERFMPPFNSLSEQERWDVVSYALTFHTTPEQVEAGRKLYKAECAECHADGFTQEKMASLSAENIAWDTTQGHADVPAIDMSEDDVYAIAAYMRTLTFAAIQPTPTPAPATATSSAAVETPAADATPVAEGTPQAENPTEAAPAAGFGNVSGVIENQTGKPLPADLAVTLHVYEHGGDMSAGPQEILAVEGVVEAGGTYKFENMELPENRIFLAEVMVNDIAYQTEFTIVEAGATEVTLSSIVLYAVSEDYTQLAVDALQIYFDYANADSVQVFAVYSIMNTTDRIIVVNMGDAQEIPFVTFPAGLEGMGYEATQDSAPFMSTANGFAMPPSTIPYGLVAFASTPTGDEFQFVQELKLNVTSLTLLVPEGVIAEGEKLLDGGVQAIQGANFHVYKGGPFDNGETLTFTISGEPSQTSSTADPAQNQNLLIGVGALGLVLILAGIWMFLRDRNRAGEESDEDEVEFEDSESIVDAIIALDDLHRAGKLNDDAYRTRRDELKSKLKEWN